MKRLDKMSWGTILGLIVPFIAIVVFYFIKYDHISFGEFIRNFKNMGVLTHVISLAVIPNLVLFFAFMQKNYLKGGRGVLLATFIFAFLVLIVRFT